MTKNIIGLRKAVRGFDKTVRVLSLFPSPNVSDRLGNTLLHYGCKYGKKKMVKELANAKGIKINAKNKKGETPLHFAALSMNFSLVSILLQNGANLSEKETKTGKTPLYYALGFRESFTYYKNILIKTDDSKILEKRMKVLSLLYNDITDIINMEDNQGICPLYYVSGSGDTNLLEKLLGLERVLV